jgi:hypothetical protein
MQPHSVPSSSRMIASYLTDIEQLLDAQNGDEALREACDLPRIAVALTDPQLRCSGEQLSSWCQQWIEVPGADPSASAPDYERVSRSVSERVAQQNEAAPVPTRALRRLQLRRHVRTPPRGFSARRGVPPAAPDSDTVELCKALVDAARRWYARSACHDTTVQSNLARLAVLR